MKENNTYRWIEIQFAFLCYDLYNHFRNYITVTAYLEFLADLAKIEKTDVMRLLQKVNQMNSIRPSNAEYIGIARKFKQSHKEIIKVIHIGRENYYNLVPTIDTNIEYYPKCSKAEVELMAKIIKKHNEIRGIGI